MKVRLLTGALLTIGALSISGTAQAQEYTAGPVRLLHNWLGDQCSFVPDLDVGDCCAEHDMAYQTPSDFPFPGTTPGTPGMLSTESPAKAR